MIAWTLFYNPMILPEAKLLWLIVPLCAAVAIVYKTIRAKTLVGLWKQVIALICYMTLGLAALGLALWFIQEYWP